MLAVCGCFWAGCRMVNSRKERIAALRELEFALLLLRGELESRAAALPELCVFLRERTCGAARALFSGMAAQLSMLGEERFSSLWNRAVRESGTALEDREREELLGLGEVLGRYELETQLRRLEGCCTVLHQCREEAERAYPGQRRLCLGLSAAAGLLLAIVLL